MNHGAPSLKHGLPGPTDADLFKVLLGESPDPARLAAFNEIVKRGARLAGMAMASNSAVIDSISKVSIACFQQLQQQDGQS